MTNQIAEIFANVHTKCYLYLSRPRFCSLQHTDQMKIYWSIKQVYQNSFSEHFDDAMAKFRSCLRNDVYNEQKEYIFYVKKDIDATPKAIEKEFASSLADHFAFSSQGLDWDVDVQMSNRMRTKREIDFYSEKRYQPVGIFVSQQRVKLVTRLKRAPNQHHLEITKESEYNEAFLKSFDGDIIDALKKDRLQILDIAQSERKWQSYAFLIATGGKVMRLAYTYIDSIWYNRWAEFGSRIHSNKNSRFIAFVT